MPLEDYVVRVAEVKIASNNISLDLGKIFCEAKQELGKGFNKFLKDEKVNYKRTQANKLITYYEYSQECQSTDTLIKLGIEKVCILSAVEYNEQQKQLQDYTLNNTISVSELKKVATKMQENAELTPSAALDEVRKEKAEAKANKKQEAPTKQALIAENEYLHARVAELEETVAKQRAELEQQTQEKSAKTSKSAEVVGMKATKQRSLIDLGKQFVSMASAS